MNTLWLDADNRPYLWTSPTPLTPDMADRVRDGLAKLDAGQTLVLPETEVRWIGDPPPLDFGQQTTMSPVLNAGLDIWPAVSIGIAAAALAVALLK